MMKVNVFLVITTLAALISCGKKTQETKPIRKDVTEMVFASGILEARGKYSLTAQADGYLENISFLEGDIIKKGQVVAIVDNKESGFNTVSADALYNIAAYNAMPNAPSLISAKSAEEIAQQKMEQDNLQVQRYKRLWESNSVAKNDYENAVLTYETSKSNYETAVENYKKLQTDAEQQLITNKATKEINKVLMAKNQIYAPVSGKVYKKYKEQGDYVKKGDVIADIGDANFIYAKVNADESNIAKVKVGQGASIRLNTMLNKIYNGTVAEIYPLFDDATQSFFVKILFNDTLDFKLINTQLQANIIVGVQKNALLIPRNFLDLGGNVTIKGQKEPTKVVTNFVSSDWVQVLAGIDDNSILVTDNIAVNKTKTSDLGSQLR
ncbi:efflux RND transporter periplasmic adaptor subunit [Parasediminibacterium sp. JCM 36343]|uniref:efflux RND transporter periplasmic adaptor subunit n=1 Tax=Parasediminibacterium sp. JCM 36343 TaxID=3374279 RepID=UPI003979993F